MTTTAPPMISVELPEMFDPRWTRLPGITVDGRRITIDPAAYFFRFSSASWLVCDWTMVRAQLLDTQETSQTALEQTALDFIRAHAHSTRDAAEVLSTAWDVYSYLFRDELLPVAGLEQIGPQEMRILREAATLMALNKVELDGAISNIGPCWLFPAATSVVFDLSDEEGAMLDEVYHSTWFNESRRIESIKAHAALGGRLAHGCQSVLHARRINVLASLPGHSCRLWPLAGRDRPSRSTTRTSGMSSGCVHVEPPTDERCSPTRPAAQSYVRHAPHRILMQVRWIRRTAETWTGKYAPRRSHPSGRDAVSRDG